MRNEIDATDLLMTCQVGDEKRDSDCAAQISHEVADARDLVIVLLAHANVRKRADGNKDQRNAHDLENPHPDDSAEVNVERNAHHPEHAYRSQEESYSDYFPRIELHRQNPGYWHQEGKGDTRWRQRHPCLLRRVSKLQLKELRNQNHGTVENDSKDKVEKRCSSEVSVLEQFELNDRMSTCPLAPDHCNQRNCRERRERADKPG